MKKTLLFLFLTTSISLFAQSFSTGTQTLLSGLTAVKPESNVCVPVEKLCANKEIEVVKKRKSNVFFICQLF